MADHRPVEFALHAIYAPRHHLAAKVRVFVDLTVRRFAHDRRGWLTAPATDAGA